ncbi:MULTISPECIES: hypothetical protein [Pantoea]|uniref:hypothetical protein n=1 Tax=Pantoea TaxID=53335 RepID=UPI001413321A|nr:MULTISPECIES: hypothetical protein [Pantoea]WRH15703.1 hypothetical protein GC087_24145 [Pantoea sp. JZ2]
MESDENLLSRLARIHNAVSNPSGGGWLFLVQGARETVFGQRAGAVTVFPSEVSRWSYSEGQRGSATGKPTGKNGSSGGKIGVRYFDEADGWTKTTNVDHYSPSLAHRYTQPAKTTPE